MEGYGKRGLRLFTAKLVFGTSLLLPGEYYNILETLSKSTTPFVEELCHKMAWLKYTFPQQQPTES